MKINWKKVRKSLEPHIGMRPEYQRRFMQARSRYAILRKSCIPHVVRWEWFSAPFYELNPIFFLGDSPLNATPGRKLKREPLSKTETVRYGFDEANQLLVSEKFAGSVEFREYASDRVDATKFGVTKRPSLIQTLFTIGKNSSTHVSFDGKTMKVRTFTYKGSRLVTVMSATDSDTGKGTGVWSYGVETLQYIKAGEILSLHHDECCDEPSRHRYKVAMPDHAAKKEPIPSLDMRGLLKPFDAFLQRTITAFARDQKHAPDSKPVSAVSLEFGWAGTPPKIWVNFDVQLIHPANGKWTHHAFAILPLPQLGDFLDDCSNHSQGGEVIDVRGKSHRLNQEIIDEPMAKWLCQLLTQVMQSAQRKHLFKPLKTTARLVVGAESYDPYFFWTSARK